MCVLSRLYYDKHKIDAGFKEQLASVVRINLNAFAESPHDLNNTNLVVHRP